MNAVRSAVGIAPVAVRAAPRPMTTVRASWVPMLMVGSSSDDITVTLIPDFRARRAMAAIPSASRSSAREAFTVGIAPSTRSRAEPKVPRSVWLRTDTFRTPRAR